MRDYIKGCISRYIDSNYTVLPPETVLVPYTGKGEMINKEHPWCNWTATFSSMPSCPYVSYKYYNMHYPDKIEDQGILYFPEIAARWEYERQLRNKLMGYAQETLKMRCEACAQEKAKSESEDTE